MGTDQHGRSTSDETRRAAPDLADDEPPSGEPRVAYGVLGVALFLALWEAACRWGGVGPIFLSPPTAVAREALALARSGELGLHLRASGAEFGLGFLLAAVTAVPLGLLAGWHRPLQFTLDPILSAFYVTPRVALLPIIVLWVGVGLASKVLIVFLGAFFPICLNTIAGVRTVDPRHLRVARSFRAGPLRTLRTIIVPSCVPFILAGLRLGVGRALVGVVVAELFAGAAGVGFLISVAGAVFRTDRVLVGVLVLMVFGVLANALLTHLEGRVERWRPTAASG